MMSSRLLGPQDDLERGVALPVDVQIAQALRDALLGDDEALLRGHEVLRVRGELGVDAAELDVRVVVLSTGLLEIDRALDLSDDRLGLLPAST